MPSCKDWGLAMHDLFQLVHSTFNVSWDIEFLTKDFPIITTGKDPLILADGTAHWQYYEHSSVYFARNFHILYKDESIELMKNLLAVRENLKTLTHKSFMVKRFIYHKPSLDRLTIIRIDSNKVVAPHHDSTRNFAINIGLKNSNTCVTNIYTGPIQLDPESNFQSVKITSDNVKHTYRMSDGDVYFVNTSQPHEVIPLYPESNKSRYIASYSL
jgi:hypothetical protein